MSKRRAPPEYVIDASENAAPQRACHADIPSTSRFRAFGVLAIVLFEISAQATFPGATPHGTAVLLLCVVGLALSQWHNLAAGTLWRAIITLGSCVPAVWHWPGAASQLLSFAVIFGAIACNQRADERQCAKGLLVTTGLLIALLMCEQTGLVWQELSRLSWSVTYFMSRLAGTGVRLGPTAIGITWYASPLCLWLAQVRLRKSELFYQVRLLLTLLGCAVLSLITRQLVFIVSASILIAAFGDWRDRPANCTLSRLKPTFAGSYCSAFIVVVLFAAGYSIRPSTSKTLFIVDGGLKTLDLPSATRIVDDSNAVFGGLKLLAPYYGWNYHILPANFDPNELPNAGVLCVINPQIALTPVQQRGVESYVSLGGGLLVLGDHTDIGGIRGPLNSLLRFTHIRFNYDSAIPLDLCWEWKGCLRGALNPVFWDRQNDNLGVCVGASLTCGPPARVLVVGDRSFSDIGRPNYGVSHLGNESYDPGERMGGLPLAAEENVGRGLVEVWGDTSGFQDTVLTDTHTMVASSFDRLHTQRVYALPGWAVICCLLALTIICILCLAPSPFWLLATLVCGCASFYIPAAIMVRSAFRQPVSAAPYLDCSHQPQYPLADPDFRQIRLCESFVRIGKVLLKANSFADLARAGKEWWVICSPTRPYSYAEAEQIETHVKEGGKLLLIAGYAHRDGIYSILKQFDLDIGPEPFGAAHNSRIVPADWRRALLTGRGVSVSPPPSTVDTSPYDADISFAESNPIISDSATPIVSCWGRNIVISQRAGAGEVILIADSRFCTNKNLGGQKINAQNVRFLLRCLQD